MQSVQIKNKQQSDLNVFVSVISFCHPFSETGNFCLSVKVSSSCTFVVETFIQQRKSYHFDSNSCHELLDVKSENKLANEYEDVFVCSASKFIHKRNRRKKLL